MSTLSPPRHQAQAWCAGTVEAKNREKTASSVAHRSHSAPGGPRRVRADRRSGARGASSRRRSPRPRAAPPGPGGAPAPRRRRAAAGRPGAAAPGRAEGPHGAAHVAPHPPRQGHHLAGRVRQRPEGPSGQHRRRDGREAGQLRRRQVGHDPLRVRRGRLHLRHHARLQRLRGQRARSARGHPQRRQLALDVRRPQHPSRPPHGGARVERHARERRDRGRLLGDPAPRRHGSLLHADLLHEPRGRHRGGVPHEPDLPRPPRVPQARDAGRRHPLRPVLAALRLGPGVPAEHGRNSGRGGRALCAYPAVSHQQEHQDRRRHLRRRGRRGSPLPARQRHARRRGRPPHRVQQVDRGADRGLHGHAESRRSPSRSPACSAT